MNYLKTLLFFILFYGHSYTKASIIVIDNDNKNMEVGKYAMVLEDKGCRLSLEDAIYSDKFIPVHSDIPNLGLSPSCFWIKLQIQNLTDNENMLLLFSQPTTDRVEFYSEENGNYVVIKNGEYQFFSKRKYSDPNYIFDIHLKKNEVKTYFLRIKSSESIFLSMTIGNSKNIFEQLKELDLFSAIYFGVMLVMALYSLFFFFSTLDFNYLYYVLYVLFGLLTQTSLQGYSFQFLWPNTPWMAIHSLTFWPELVGIMGLEFLKKLLNVKDKLPLLYKVSFVFILIYFVAIVLGLNGNIVISYKIMEINSFILSLFMLYISFKIYIRSARTENYFLIALIAWIVFLGGVCVFVLKDFELLPYNNFTRYSIHIGSAIEAMLFSFALADRINILKREKEESQEKTMEVLQQNEKIITEQNITLGSKVKERTHELEMLNTSLKETQTQLVNAEKMASLGQLTAGIAHEINNPINFVISNIKPLQRDVNDILHLLSKYSEIEDDKELKEKLALINISKETLDINYLITEINLLLKGIDEGANRTAAIIKGLRTFSLLDEDDLKKADIHEGLDATLTLLNSNIVKKEIKIIKEYDSNIKPIECYPGKVNQVFMNILHNAIQALGEKKDAKKENYITIKTYTIAQSVFISIKDNGPGIPKKNQNKIFEPFFTTKQVGEGTGLGLSIVHSIIKSHKGEIQIESEEGKGTEFIITLPIIQS